mgnify:CR=1 FL=1
MKKRSQAVNVCQAGMVFPFLCLLLAMWAFHLASHGRGQFSPSLRPLLAACIVCSVLAETVLLILRDYLVEISARAYTDVTGVQDKKALEKYLRQLRERSDTLQLVFVTGYTDFVFDGYAVGALGYVMKPPQPEQIGDVLTRALAVQFNEADKVFLCRNTDGLFRIPKKSIRYFYSDRRQVTCVTDTRSLTFYARLDDVAESVGAVFVRIHQRYLVRAGGGGPGDRERGVGRGGNPAHQPLLPAGGAACL